MGDYRGFVESIGIAGIFLNGLVLDVRRDMVPGREARVTVKSDERVSILHDEGQVVARVDYGLSAREEHVRKAYCSVKVTFDVILTEATGGVPEEHEDAFSTNMVLVTWPYLREIVDSMSTRAGVLIPTAPLRFGQIGDVAHGDE